MNIFSRGYYTRKVRKKAVEAGTDLQVNYKSTINKNTHLGNNVNFNGMSIRGGGSVTIGDNFHSGTDCLIMTENHNYDDGDAIPYDDTYIHKDVTIDDNVWLGSRVTILPGITIEEGAIIQAGSTVTSDIPKGAIAGGHPAEVFDKRDMEHYERHEKEGNFH
ncbi:acyltransferase [Halorubrum ezzemoulense]|uniref:acyltransferase n=1 Tax=Halorubrum ezzemoulense TaxID=337243 RepID=UPI0023311A95|nr:acyltransferase [Halorubrum ezzemoulense]MDB2286713.1 acyltransferase [Halorubrum ezzemoulense]